MFSQRERDVVSSYKLGVNAYVVKPVDLHELVNAIKELGVVLGPHQRAAAGNRKKEVASSGLASVKVFEIYRDSH